MCSTLHSDGNDSGSVVGKPEVIQKGAFRKFRTLQHKGFKLALIGLFPHL